MEYKTLGIIALKGGVGKTTVTANLGSILASEFNKNVLMVDGNFSTPHLALSMGLVDPKVTLHDVLNNKASVFDALHRHDSGVYLIPGSPYPIKSNPSLLKNKLSEISEYYDIVIIDASPSLNDEVLATMMASDGLLVVTSPDYPTLASTIHAVRLAKQRHTPILGLILNRTRNKKYELSIDDIEKATGVPVLSIIPNDDKVLEALSQTTPAVLHSPKRKVANEYRRLAQRIINENYESLSKKEKDKFDAIIKKFKKSILDFQKFITKRKGGIKIGRKKSKKRSS